MAQGVLSKRSAEAMTKRSTAHPAIQVLLGLLAFLLSVPSMAHASLFSPEVEDKLASIIALVVIFVVPVVLIVLFWMVHILPEKIAHKRHHPQFEAIRTLCLLSLVFGGLLWPIAWLWAYSKPVFYKMAYGTDKHPDAMTGVHVPADERVDDQLDQPEGPVSASELMTLRARLEALEARLVRNEVH
jgi:CBS domain containing-hemolysin-like protein